MKKKKKSELYDNEIISDPIHLSILFEAGILAEASWRQVPGKNLFLIPW